MGRQGTRWTEDKIAERIRSGRGEGEDAAYQPWLTIRDFSSQGTTTRIWSPKLQRAVTVFSNIERNSFFVAEFNRDFAGYREQAPMPREETRAIADDLGIKHPIYPGTRVPTVMTLDGLLSLRTPFGTRTKVVDCKAHAALSNPRTQQKLAINREYARRHGYDYLLQTEHSIPQTVTQNVQWIRMSAHRSGDQGSISNADIYRTRLLRSIADAIALGTPYKTVRDFLNAFDEDWHLPDGFALRMFRQLAATHNIGFDLLTHFRVLLAGPLTALTFLDAGTLDLLSGAEASES